MTNQEKLSLMEELWISLDNKEDLDSPRWHKEIIESRLQSVKDGTAEYISIDFLRNSK